MYSFCAKLNSNSASAYNDGTVDIGTVAIDRQLTETGTPGDFGIEQANVDKYIKLVNAALPVNNSADSGITTNESTTSEKYIGAVTGDITSAVNTAKTNKDSYINTYAATGSYAKIHGMAEFINDIKSVDGTAIKPFSLCITYDRTARADDAVAAIASAADAQEAKAILKEYEVEFGIDSSIFDNFEDSDTEEICNAMAGKSYSDTAAVKAAFELITSDKEPAKVKFECVSISTGMAGTNNNVPVLTAAEIKKLKNYDGDIKVVAAMYDKEGTCLKLIDASSLSNINRLRYADAGDMVTVEFFTSGSAGAYTIASGCAKIKVFVLKSFSSLCPLANVGKTDYAAE